MPALAEMATRERDREIRKDMKRRLKSCAGQNSRLLFLLSAGLQIVFIGVLFLEKILPLPESLYAVATTPLLYGIALLLLFPWMIVRGNRQSPAELRQWLGRLKAGYQVNFKFMIRWILIGVGMTQLFHYLISGFLFFAGMLSGLDLVGAPAMIQPDTLNRLTTLIAAVAAAPILEEVLFRAIILRRTLKYGEWFAIFSTAVACSLISPKPAQAVNSFVIGVVCGFVMVKSKSVWPGVGVHACLAFLNTASLVLDSLLLGEDGHRYSYIFYVAEGSPLVSIGVNVIRVINFGAIFVGAFLLFQEITRYRSHFILENALPGLTAVQKTLAYITAPVSLCFIALTVLILWLAASGLDLSASRWLTLLL